MKKFLKEFGEFINKGNIMSLAIGVVIGAAFQAIVNSLVKDIIMPLLSLLTKGNLADMVWIMKDAVLDEEGNVVKAAITLNYGAFIQAVINFLIIAFSIFLAMKAINKLQESAKKIGEKVKDKVEGEIQEIKEDMNSEETSEVEER